jgi:hypothetical protein
MKNQAEQKVKDIIIENGGFPFIFQTIGRSQQAVSDTFIQISVQPVPDKKLI